MNQEETVATIKELETKLNEFVIHKCEVYSRVVGYFRPVQQWNVGKKDEWDSRVMYKV